MSSWTPAILQDLSRSLGSMSQTNKIVLASAASASMYFFLWPILQRRMEYMAVKNLHELTKQFNKEHKEKLFEDMDSLPKVDGEIVILELGIGPGVNLQFYPKGSHVIASDLHALGEEEISQKCVEQGLVMRKYVVTGAEDLSMFPTGSISAVVVTLVLCSVQNMEVALREIKRVLVPGGKLYFYEHTRNFEENNRLLTFAQVALFVPYLSIFYCNTLVNQLPALFKVFGESNVEFRQFVVVKEGVAKVILYPVSPHVAGKAIKGENARVLSKDMVSDKQQ